jgi:hypothetical protein
VLVHAVTLGWFDVQRKIMLNLAATEARSRRIVFADACFTTAASLGLYGLDAG